MVVAAVAVVGVIGAFTISSATAQSYTCGEIWQPEATPSPAPSGPVRGLVQPDMGNSHVVASPQGYRHCPPASGNHFAQPRAPIPARVYGPDDAAQPTGWVHNLEHGALVLLYRGRPGDPGLTEEAQEQLRTYFQNFPDSPICGTAPGGEGPVFARFDDMAWPYAALLWNRVLPLETLDTELINRFYATEGDRNIPEPRCQVPAETPSAAPLGSAAGSATPSGSAVSPAGSAAPSGPAAGASPDASAALSPSAS